MRLRSLTDKKLGQDSAAAPVPTSLRSRPFTPQAKQVSDHAQSLPELQTQAEIAQRWGHSFSKSVSASSAKGLKLPTGIQPKLTIGAPRDKYEQEADRVAHQAVQRLNTPQAQRSLSNPSLPWETHSETPSVLHRKPLLQRQSTIAEGAASTDLEHAIHRARGCGQPLDTRLQRSLGQAMGADFSRVKVHTDAQADQLNQAIQAKAFTTGHDVFFRQGAYQPGNRGGQELIAHELTHVVQQNGGGVQQNAGTEPQQIQKSQPGQIQKKGAGGGNRRVSGTPGDMDDVWSVAKHVARKYYQQAVGLTKASEWAALVYGYLMETKYKKGINVPAQEMLDNITKALNTEQEYSVETVPVFGGKIQMYQHCLINMIPYGEGGNTIELGQQTGQSENRNDVHVRKVPMHVWMRVWAAGYSIGEGKRVRFPGTFKDEQQQRVWYTGYECDCFSYVARVLNRAGQQGIPPTMTQVVAGHEAEVKKFESGPIGRFGKAIGVLGQAPEKPKTRERSNARSRINSR